MGSISGTLGRRYLMQEIYLCIRENYTYTYKLYSKELKQTFIQQI